MLAPTLPWAGYNLFRITAVVIMAWALVVQFVALSQDMKAYSESKDDVAAVNATAATATATTPALVGTSIGVAASSQVVTPSSVPTVAVGTISIATTTATTTAETGDDEVVPTANKPPVGVVTPTSTPNIGVIGLDPDSVGSGGLKRHRRRTRQLHNRADEEDAEEQDDEDDGDDGDDDLQEVVEASYFGESAVPNQPGGAFFVVISRLLIAGTLLVLLFAQLGLPEDILYRHGGLLGPQSTPVALGGLQLVIAIETLRVHAEQSVLLPSWLLLGVGLVNILLAIALLILGRRLPPDPPHPLYFSKMQRLLYWRPLPAFYAQLDPSHPSHPSNQPRLAQHQDDQAHQLANRRPSDPEKQQPSSNALEIGLEEVDEEEQARLNEQMRDGRVRTRPTREEAEHTDVTKGGYPTFSGHAVNAPGRNVPAGYVDVEDDRGGVSFVSEEAQRVREAQIQHARRNARQSVRMDKRQTRSTADFTGKQDQAESQGRKGKPAPLRISSSTTSTGLRRPPARGNSRDSTVSTVSTISRKSTQPLRPRPSLKSKQPTAPSNTLTPIGEGDEPNTAMTSRSDLRKSLQAATTDLGPHFPLPPSRSDSGDTVQMPKNGVKDGPKARRESSVDSMAGAAPWALARDSTVVREPVPTSPLKVYTESAARVSEILRVQAPSSPHVPMPAKSLVAPEPASPKRPVDRRPDPSKPQGRPLTMLRSSLAPDTRSPTTVVARTERVARGVRFDLASPDALSPESDMTGTPTVASPRSGIRVPGTSFTIPIPFTTPSTPRPQRGNSVDSDVTASSSFSAARPESFASTASIDSAFSFERPEMIARGSSGTIDPDGVRRGSDERAGLPRRDSRQGGPDLRPRSVAVLGGGYLDGGSETQKQRRRYSSIDSF